MSSASKEWIYHERQDALLCGQHALNNLVQSQVFSPDSLAEIAHQLDALELQFMKEGNDDKNGVLSKDYIRHIASATSGASNNVDESGNFSIQVLRAALSHHYGLELTHLNQLITATTTATATATTKDITDYEGFVCHNASSQHWFAIRKIGGRFYNLDSLLPQPKPITSFELATNMLATTTATTNTTQSKDNHPNQVFAVTGGPLPPTDPDQTGKPEYWWKIQDVLNGTNTNNNSDSDNNNTQPKHSWENLGTGLRLDGKKPKISSHDDEDEQIRAALAASMNPALTTEPNPHHDNNNNGDGISTIRFRLVSSSNKKLTLTRRFRNSEPVSMIYSYIAQVQEQQQLQGAAAARLELRYGYPPKDLDTMRYKDDNFNRIPITIGETDLNGECIQGRWR